MITTDSEFSPIKFDDNQEDKSLPPFVQADSFDRIISLLENMNDNPMNDEEIAELMHFGSNLSNGKPVFLTSISSSNVISISWRE